MEKEKLIRQLFMGKVADVIGLSKTLELMKEAIAEIEALEKQNKSKLVINK